MTGLPAETTAPASTAEAVTTVETAPESAEAKTSSVTTSEAPISRWPWWATLAVAVGLLIALFVVQGQLWGYITATSEAKERADFDQLKAIVDNVQSVVMLLVGAIFGVGATQGVTAAAARAADANKSQAERANQVANDNAAAAQANAKRSTSFEQATRKLATAIVAYTDGRRADDTRFLADIGSAPTVEGIVQLRESDLSAYDPELDRMAGDARRIINELA